MVNRKYLPLLLFITVLNALSGCTDITEPLLTSSTVALQAPANGVISSDNAQTFYWEPVKDATRYQLQLVTPRFDSIVVLLLDTIIPVNQFPWQLMRGNYQWRVKALNTNSSTSFSNTWHLQIQ